MVYLVKMFRILCKKVGPICVAKLAFIYFYLDQNSDDGKNKKKNGFSLVPFLSIFGNHFGAHFGTRSAKEGAR